MMGVPSVTGAIRQVTLAECPGAGRPPDQLQRRPGTRPPSDQRGPDTRPPSDQMRPDRCPPSDQQRSDMRPPRGRPQPTFQSEEKASVNSLN